MKAREAKTDLVNCRRGSMAVEMLVLVPLFVLLWQIANILHAMNYKAHNTIEETRSCAWRHALRGCEAPPGGCQIGSRGELAGGEIDAAAGGGFSIVGSQLSFLGSTLEKRHGSVIEARGRDSVRNPLWSDIQIGSSHVVMCNTPTQEWEEREVVQRTCTTLMGGRWCP